jgi:hypothetical protein
VKRVAAADLGIDAVQAQRMILLPDIDWVEIPGGDFIYQEGERRSLPTFYMARYPVTNVQYQTFIDAGGYGDQRWWADLVRPEPDESRWSQANRPRTNVDWYEAVAFSRWLSAQLGYEVRLADRGRMGARGTRTGWARVSLGRGVPDGLRQYRRKGTAKPASGPWSRRQRSVAIRTLRRLKGFSISPATSGNGVSTNMINRINRSRYQRRQTRGAWWCVELRPGPRARLAAPQVQAWTTAHVNWGFRLVSSAPIA